MAQWTGLEPATPGVTGRYSNQLNYHCFKALLPKPGKPRFIAAGVIWLLLSTGYACCLVITQQKARQICIERALK